MTERKMATIQLVNGVYPIEGADRICQYGINGWKVIDAVGKYKVGDPVIFCEIDSWIPNHVAPFLSKGKDPRMFNGVPGEKLRTIRMKKALSQGLLLPVQDNLVWQEGMDMSTVLGILKWEPPPSAYMQGKARGNFPHFIRKTDQERVQNMPESFLSSIDHRNWIVTEKLEGSSLTIYHSDGDSGVCSRNIDLKDEDDNRFWMIEHRYKVIDKLKLIGRNIAIQGELIGPGVQGNIYGLVEHDFYVFNIFDIDQQGYIPPEVARFIAGNLGLKFVPLVVWDRGMVINRESLLEFAEGKSILNPLQEREGLVFWKYDGHKSFKAVSNKYLEKQ